MLSEYPRTVATAPLTRARGLRAQVDGLLAACIDAGGDSGVTLPYDGFLLTVRSPPLQAPAGEEAVATAWLWPLRSRPGRWHSCPEGCLTLMAMLRPEAALALMREQRFGEMAQAPTPLAALTGPRPAARLQAAVAAAHDIDAKLDALARWLEDEVVRRRVRDAGTRRLGQAAAALNAHASLPVVEVAGMVGLHRRYLEREFGRWLGVSPKQLQLAARLQHVARRAWQGESAAGIAAELGFVDASHLAHMVRELTGMTVGQFARSDASLPLAQGFRAATAGAHLFAR